MARMSIDDKFLRDARVVLLGRRFGWSRRETMGALLDVFALTYDQETDVISSDEIDVAAGEAGFAQAMIDVDLGEHDDAGVRIKGAAERIEYLAAKREAGRKGGRKSGESRRNKHEAKRSSASSDREARGNLPDPVPDLPPDPVPAPDLQDQKVSLPRDPTAPVPHQPVRPVPQPTPVDGRQPGSGQPWPRAQASDGGGHVRQGEILDAGNVAEPQTSPTPDRAGQKPSTGDFPRGIGNGDTDCNRPRTLQPTSDFATDAQTPRREPDRPRRPTIPTADDRRAIRDEMRELINAARERVGAKIGQKLNPCLAFENGLDGALAGHLALATTRAELDDVAKKARYAIAMGELEAIADPVKRVQYLNGAIFSGGNFPRLASQTPEGAAAMRPRAGPRSSAERAPPKRDIRVGAVQPSDPSLYPDGVIEIP